ncbi:MAG: PfkB family carbohydrate kinase [Myxococcales bacterium]
MQMSLLVTGSIGIDSIQTPAGQAADVLGGSAIYFSFAASLLAPVRLVGVVGEDFPRHYLDLFKGRPIDPAGLEIRKGSKTFRWQGRYVGDMNEAETLRTDLNVLAENAPKVPAAFRDSKVVFLANTHPALQRELLAQVEKPEFVVCDTMNLWIKTTRDELCKTLGVVDGVVLNDGEARLLTTESLLVRAGRQIQQMGPKLVLIKKGEHGCLMFYGSEVWAMPAFPTAELVDPTARATVSPAAPWAISPRSASTTPKRSGLPSLAAPWLPPSPSRPSASTACVAPRLKHLTLGSNSTAACLPSLDSRLRRTRFLPSGLPAVAVGALPCPHVFVRRGRTRYPKRPQHYCPG